MISLLSGNSRILLTVNERGRWSQLYFPAPGLHQQLREARVGIFDEATRAFVWTDDARETPARSSYVEDSNAGRTVQPVQATATFIEPTEEAIRARAYEIYLARGQEPGHETEDWSQAESELRNPSVRP